MTCFKCGGGKAKARKRKHSTSPAHLRGSVALCDGCYAPNNPHPGNPAYWAFRARCSA